MRHSILAVPLGLVLAIGGCAAAEPEPSEAPSTSASPSASETPSPTPSQTPTPTEEPVAEPQQCGDAYVVDSNRNDIGPLPGTDEEVLAQLAPRPGFIAADALQGLDVLCAVTTTHVVDGPPNADGSPRILAISVAFLAGPAADESLTAWVTANGYVVASGGPYPEFAAPAAADGTTTTKIVWRPVSNLGWDEAELARQSELLGVAVQPDDRMAVFYDYTIPQG